MNTLKLPEHVRIAKHEKGWYLICKHWTEEFPYSGYLRNDGTWAMSMQIGRENGKDVYGYFDTEEEAIKGLEPWIVRADMYSVLTITQPHPNCRCVLDIKDTARESQLQPTGKQFAFIFLVLLILFVAFVVLLNYITPLVFK